MNDLQPDRITRSHGEREPRLSRLTADVEEVRPRLEHPEDDGEAKAAGADGAGIEDEQPSIATEKGDVRVTADDETRPYGRGGACDICPQPDASHGDVGEEDLEPAVAPVEPQMNVVGYERPAVVDVAPNGHHRGDGLEIGDHLSVADVAGMEDERRV